MTEHCPQGAGSPGGENRLTVRHLRIIAKKDISSYRPVNPDTFKPRIEEAENQTKWSGNNSPS